MSEPIVKTRILDRSPQVCFHVFVNRLATWWPVDTHSVSAGSGQRPQSVEIEPKPGGAVFEITQDGTRCDWGRVLVFEPNRRLSMTWHPGHAPDKATHVDVTFDDIGNDQTRVTMTHTGWEVWAETAETRRENYDTGWDSVLSDGYVKALEKT